MPRPRALLYQAPEKRAIWQLCSAQISALHNLLSRCWTEQKEQSRQQEECPEAEPHRASLFMCFHTLTALKTEIHNSSISVHSKTQVNGK